LEHEIRSGRLDAGPRLPSEPELCEQYTLSRTTVRQALARLEQRGPIDRPKGQGTFVHGGRRTLEAIPAESWLAERLEAKPDAPLAFIESVTWDSNMNPFDSYRAWLRTDRTRVEIQASEPAAAATHPLSAHAGEKG
jgi:DNA-binding GntR family transcriptional regulator